MRPVCIAALLLVASPVSAQPEIRVGTPTPGWVPATEAPSPTPGFEEGVEHLLRHLVLRPGDREALRYERRVYRVWNPSGVQTASELGVDVASDETLEWHHVRIRREGRTLERLTRRQQLRVIQPGDGLDEHLYDARHRAVLFLEDVRVGDTIEFAFTVHRSTALFDGRYIERELLPFGMANRVRVDAQWPAERGIRARLHRVDEEYVRVNEPGVVSLEANDGKVPDAPADAPGWFVAPPRIDMSEFASWGEVARWGAQIYEPLLSAPLPESVPIGEIQDRDELLVSARRALEYVQDDVRYLGLEMGEHALVPHEAHETARRRFGDCKDKSALLVVLLRSLGLRADAALVHAGHRAGVADELPSPYAFNHVIVRAEVDGRPVWLDPTRSAERGPFSNRPPVTLGQGLVLSAETTSLEAIAIDSPSEPEMEVVERFYLMRNRPTLRVQTVFRGGAATRRRALLREVRRTELQQWSRRYLRESGYTLRVVEPMQITDDEEANEIRLDERFVLGDFWDAEERDVSPWSLAEYLVEPGQNREGAPLAVPHPVFVRHRVEIEDPAGWNIMPASRQFAPGPLRIRHDVQVLGPELVVVAELRTVGDEVGASDVAAYAAALNEAQQALGYGVTNRPEHMRQNESQEVDPVAASICAGLVSLFVLGFFGRAIYRASRRGSRRRDFRRKQQARQGETPESALSADSLNAAMKKHRSPRCCGSVLDLEEWSVVRLGEARMAVAAVTCPQCEKRHRTHYRLADESAHADDTIA